MHQAPAPKTQPQRITRRARCGGGRFLFPRQGGRCQAAGGRFLRCLLPGPGRRAGSRIGGRARAFHARRRALRRAQAEQFRLSTKAIRRGAESASVEGALLKARQARKSLRHQIIPATNGQLLRAIPAANDQPIFCPRQRHIQQAMFFFRLSRLIRLALRGQCWCLKPLYLRRPNGQRFAAIFKPAQRLAVLRLACCVGQNDDGRLQTLGTMHGHDAHHIAGGFRFALDLGPALAEPMHKALQGWRVELFMFQSGIEQFIKRIARIRPKPRQNTRAPRAGIERTWRAKHIGEQAMGRDEIKPRRLD